MRPVALAREFPARAAILLATRNGEAFLGEQLHSLAGQTHPLIDVWVSDDGSTDRTLALLDAWRGRWDKGAFHILVGPRAGFAENFRALIVNPAIEADVYAFCDQDDLWEAGKLEAALAWMGRHDMARPHLFCSRTLTVSRCGTPLGASPLFRKSPSFRNALVQSLAGGNTMVLNAPAWKLLGEASRRASFVSHDWWAYQLVTGAGGLVRYDPEPRVRYRQHADNLVGANSSWAARLGRLGLLMRGRFRRWNDVNLEGLARNRHLLTPDALEVLRLFERARKSGLPFSLIALRRSGVYRQTFCGTLGLWAAVVLGRM